MRFDPYAADTEAYRHVSLLARHLAGGALDASIRSLVELRASQISGCAFCLTLHATTARHAQVPQRKLDLLAGWREAEDFSPPERAALALTEETVRIGDGRRVTDETWAHVRSQFSDAEISGLLYTLALIRFWNTLNVAVEFPAGAALPNIG
jgi:AhpD family alkylhydroperoxidase